MATYIELQKQIAALQKQADALKAEERAGVIERMREAIGVYEITAQELGFAGSARRSPAGVARKAAGRPAKASKRGGAAYADSNGNTWGGRGPRPRWLRAALEAGAQLEDFAQARK